MLKASECVYQAGTETHFPLKCVFSRAVLCGLLLNLFTVRLLLVGGWTVAASGVHFALAEKSCGGRASRAGGDQLPQLAATGPAPLLWFSVAAGTGSCSAELTQPLPEAFL